MATDKTRTAPAPTAAGDPVVAVAAARAAADLRKQYECGPVPLPADPNAAFERHLVFDHMADPKKTTGRQRFEALGLALRDLLAQRWLRTKQTYHRENPKRVYYLSMEFLIGRSLANNVANLLVEPVARRVMEREGLRLEDLVEGEPDAGLGNGGLGRLAACFIDSLATLQVPAHGYGLRYEYGIFRQRIENGYQVEAPDNWLRYPDPWEVARYDDTVEVHLNASVQVVNGAPQFVPNRPTTLLGTPYDRPVVGYGGKTINTLRLWGAASPHYFNFG
ncbi:MAG TPA: glycogen/starch/alpha-glucan phosphorylase, partial [Gemmataceae bacterium]|nr:glycogen/starch/alpha-glucan phosphorylase [Gemmataceae bacterium]